MESVTTPLLSAARRKENKEKRGEERGEKGVGRGQRTGMKGEGGRKERIRQGGPDIQKERSMERWGGPLVVDGKAVGSGNWSGALWEM